MKATEQSQAPVDGVACLDTDPYSEDVLASPDDWYEELREAGDVVWLSRYGVWATGRHENVARIFGDWESFPSSRGVGLSDFKKDKVWRPKSIILETDPPDHSRARIVLARAMSPKAIRKMRDGFSAHARSIVSTAIEKGHIDGMTDLAKPFPLRAFPDALGLAPDEREKLLEYGSMVFNSIGPINRLVEEDLKNLAEIAPWIAARCSREALTPDGMGAVIYDAVDNGDLTEEEGPLLMRAFLSAGVDTTVNAIGNTLYLFSQNPDQWRRLREDPTLLKNAFEEVLRRESPVHTFFRTTDMQDVKIGNVSLGTERKVLLCIAAANRDPRKFEDPDAFDISRNARGHVAFGTGIHACVGQMVARMEAEVLLSELINRVVEIRPAGEPVWRPNNALHGLEALPLELVSK